MKQLLPLILCAIITGPTSAQPLLQWQKSLGGSANDECRAIQQTKDGGYIVAGFTASTDGDISSNHGMDDIWIIKLNEEGAIQWQKTLGGTNADRVYSILQTNDNGYILAGASASDDGDLLENHGDADCWVLKLNETGDILWQSVFGGSQLDRTRSIQQTNDGGFIVAGFTMSTDGDVSGNHGGADYWVLKLNETGQIQWQKTLGGQFDDLASCIRQTGDGGYIVGGTTASFNGDVSANHGMNDFWVVKLDAAGVIQWQKVFGGNRDDVFYALVPTLDGGYILAGYTESTTGDVTGFKGERDCWVVKINETGQIQWQKTLGGNYYEEATSILQMQDGTYIMSASVYSKAGDVTNNHGARDYWVVQLTDPGTILWQKTFGGTGTEYPLAIQRTSDNGFIVGGITDSKDGDVSTYYGEWDIWVVKLTAAPVGVGNPAAANRPPSLEVYPNPSAGAVKCVVPTASVTTLAVDVYDSMGRHAARQTISNGGAVHLSELPDALYWLVATTPSGQQFFATVLKQE